MICSVLVMLSVLLLLHKRTLSSFFKESHLWWVLCMQFKGPPVLTFAQNTLLFFYHKTRFKETSAMYQNLFETYGSLFRIWVQTRPYIVLANPSAVEAILTSKLALDKDDLSLPMSTGVDSLNGTQWKRRRKLLNLAFSSDKHYSNVSLCKVAFEQSLLLLKKLEEEEGQLIDICPAVARCVMDILGEVGMNLKLGCQNHKSEQYYAAMTKKQKSTSKLSVILESMYSGESRKPSPIQNYTTAALLKRRLERDEPSYREVSSFLDFLLDAQEDNEDGVVSDEVICEEVVTYMRWGFDTIATSVAWTIKMLSLYPDVQEKARQEVLGIYRTQGQFDIDSMYSLRYLDSVLKETLRLFPPIPAFYRVLNEDIHMQSGQLLPKGASVQVNAFLLHRNPATFSDPGAFNPDRFFVGGRRHPYALIPFSSGKRNCPAQHLSFLMEKVILCNILTKFAVTPHPSEEKEALDAQNVDIEWGDVLRPKGGVVVRLIPST